MSRELEVLHYPPEGGTRKVSPLLFVHGAYTGAWCWETHFLPWFAAHGFDVYALSLSGHAGSAGREKLDHFGLHDFTADVLQVMDTLPAMPVVIGHSLGGYLAQTVARQRALPGMALLASVPPYGLVGSLSHMGLSAPHLLWGLGRHQLAHPLTSRLPEFDLVMMRELLFSEAQESEKIRSFSALTQPESMRALAELVLPHPFQFWREPRIPALVIGLERDRIIPTSDVWMTARAWHTEPVFFTEPGHALMLDHGWEQIALAIAKWLEMQFPASNEVAQ